MNCSKVNREAKEGTMGAAHHRVSGLVQRRIKAAFAAVDEGRALNAGLDVTEVDKRELLVDNYMIAG